jgi:hypothetical protein
VGKEVSSGRSQSRLAVRYGKEKEERKDEAMIARFDHRPMLTAALALSTTVLILMVVTLSTLLITLPQAASPPSLRGSGNPAGPAPKVMDAASYGEVYGWNIQAGGSNFSNDSAVDSHAEAVAAFHNAK